jgi:four helix bundle protein
MSGFEKILAWQKSRDLVIDIYETFNKCKDFSFRDQIQRAAISTTNNIAEETAKLTSGLIKYLKSQDS